MRPHFQDVTAGIRAREIREHPDIPHPIFDPTDAHFGEVPPDARQRASAREPAVDATDPLYGQTLD